MNESLGYSGRPIGRLWAFLTCAHLYADKDAHKAGADWKTHEARSHARTDLHNLPGSSEYEEAEVGYNTGIRDEPLVSE